jgi:phosphoribosylaminoimidazolecarboxamide formyltransferase / IMP cyclohydrolase
MSKAVSAPIARALLSVFDKSGLIEFTRELAGLGVELISTGGTARSLKSAGLAVTELEAYTGFPEMLDGRVKTLHPKIHGGILGIRDNPEHARQMRAHGIGPIDLVVSNLYPFEATVAKGAAFEECVENIDIGGPSLVRAAAKNHAAVTVLVEPGDYAAVLADMRAHAGATTPELRRHLAAKAYAHTAAYDSAISRWFAGALGQTFPERLTLSGARRQLLRYGENPHQEAALYAAGESRAGVATARQPQGKELSYNNLNDTDAAYELAAEFDSPAVVIVKHANPCGVAIGADLAAAYAKALACDPVSAFGGIVAVNRKLDAGLAAELGKLFLEVVIAPDADPRALEILSAKKNLRLLLAGGLPDRGAPGLVFRSLAGGFLAQTRDAARVGPGDLKVVTKREPSAAEIADMLFAFAVAKHVKSNAIVYAKGGATVGIGAGQMSRVDSSRIAAWKAREAGEAAGERARRTEGAVVASDAFFPFADGLIAAADAGVGAVIQPGGSVRDGEVIEAADARGLAMVFTGTRHFRH